MNKLKKVEVKGHSIEQKVILKNWKKTNLVGFYILASRFWTELLLFFLPTSHPYPSAMGPHLHCRSLCIFGLKEDTALTLSCAGVCGWAVIWGCLICLLLSSMTLSCVCLGYITLLSNQVECKVCSCWVDGVISHFVFIKN